MGFLKIHEKVAENQPAFHHTLSLTMAEKQCWASSLSKLMALSSSRYSGSFSPLAEGKMTE